MRSYIKVVQTSSGLIFPADLANLFGVSGDVMRLQIPSQITRTNAYNAQKQAQHNFMYAFNQNPQNLVFGALDPDPSNTIPARISDGTTVVFAGSGTQIAESFYNLLPYGSHPLN